MATLTTYIEQIRQMFVFGDHNLLTKRIIDLTLDTQNPEQYKKTNSLLEWIDLNEKNIDAVKQKLQNRFDELCDILSGMRIDESNDMIISTVNLTKKYHNAPFKLGPITMNVAKRQIIGLVGENGNGKTTLLRSLCGELLPTEGKITYHFAYTDKYDLRSKLIYIPQRTKSWKGGLLSNLQYTAAMYGIKGDENMSVVDLALTRMGLRKYKNYEWKNLSSGYKMRFELARVLLQKPKILLIDEPLANLDILAQQTVLDDFRHIAQSPFRPMGIVLSSQQLYEVEKASDEVIFLKKGMPRNLIKEEAGSVENLKQFLIEFESSWEQERLYALFQKLGIDNLQINGGTYVASFPDNIKQEDFLKVIMDNNVPVSYFRDITNSTRRFFLS